MVSQLFLDMLRRAVREAHPTIVTCERLRPRFTALPFTKFVSLAASLVAEGAAVDDAIEELGLRWGVLRERAYKSCPICNQSSCPSAMTLIPLGATTKELLQHLMAGGFLPGFSSNE